MKKDICELADLVGEEISAVCYAASRRSDSAACISRPSPPLPKKVAFDQ
jgi:hypothetical protein